MARTLHTSSNRSGGKSPRTIRMLCEQGGAAEESREASPDEPLTEASGFPADLAVDLTRSEPNLRAPTEKIPVQPASKDIRGDLGYILDDAFTFKGSPSFTMTHFDMPNPALNLPYVGLIGLPMSPRDAEAAISACEQAAASQGAPHLAQSQFGPWQLDGALVQFLNPKWKDFIGGLAKTVCQSLGVDIKGSRPQLELHKLLVNGAGRCLVTSGSDKMNNSRVIGEVLVLLPSPHTGGGMQLNYGSFTNTADTSIVSLFGTSVLAWYKGVHRLVKPVASAFQLALSYKLVHTTDSPVPALPDISVLVDDIRYILLSWNQRANESGVPEKLVYLLEHECEPRTMPNSVMLAGLDATKFDVLQTLAHELNFHIGLVRVKCYAKGYGDDPRRLKLLDGESRDERYGKFGKYGKFGDEEEDDGWSDSDDEDAEMIDVDASEMVFEDFVDCNGKHLKKYLTYKDDELIPVDLRDVVEERSPSKQDYDGYLHGEGSLQRWWYRAAIVLWPHRSNIAMEYGEDPEAVIPLLADIKSCEPSDDDRYLADFLIRAVAGGSLSPVSCVRELCNAASLWKDCALWLRAVDVCGASRRIGLLGVDGIVAAVVDFGLEPVKFLIETALSSEPSNISRWELLKAMVCMTAERGYNMDAAWIAQQRQVVLSSLRAPQTEEAPLIMDMIRVGGGVPFLQCSLLPQFLAFPTAQCLFKFAQHLHAEKETILRTPEQVFAVDSVITELLVSAISKEAFLRKSASGEETREGATLALSYIRVCLWTNNRPLVEMVIDQLTDTKVLDGETEPSLQAAEIFLGVATGLRATYHEDQIPAFFMLAQSTVKIYFALRKSNPMDPTFMGFVFRAMMFGDSLAILQSVVIPTLKSLPASIQSCRAFMQQLQNKDYPIAFPADDSTTTSQLIADMVQDVVQRTEIGRHHAVVLSLLDLCLDTQVSPAKLLSRVLHPKDLEVDERYVNTLLMPLLQLVPAILKQRNIACTAEPFCTTFKFIIIAYVQRVLGPKPPSATPALEKVTKNKCTCDCCKQLVNFFVRDTGRQLELRRLGSVKRKHVERQLEAYGGRRLSSWRIHGSPEGLTITKSDVLSKGAAWATKQLQGQRYLAAMGVTDDVLQNVLGSDYDQVMLHLTGKEPPSRTLPAAQQSVPTSYPPQAIVTPVTRTTPGTAGPTAVMSYESAAMQASRVPTCMSSSVVRTNPEAVTAAPRDPLQNPTTPIPTTENNYAIPSISSTKHARIDDSIQPRPPKKKRLDYENFPIIDLT